MIAEIILQMRLYALYFLDRKVLVMMVATFIVTAASSAAIMGVVLSKITAFSVPIPVIGSFCVPTRIPNWFYTFWIPILTFETVLCALVLMKGVQTFRASGSPFQSGRKLVGILIRDSVVYYLVMLATYLTCLLVWVIGTTDMLEIPIGFSIAMSCVLGNRVILNVRLANREIEESKVAATSSNHPPGFDQQHSHAQSWITQAGSRISQGAASILKSASRSEHGKQIDYDDHVIDTLTDMEMAQLRTMQAHTPVHASDGFIVI
ncbi:hypothetical protein D9758_015718 [Tetrapyrgos nigripes]|uniref:Uncharacterized protein n=1 Tax=Tetrapyrgos nigripes TaxID=182062 RepID=A0A8H5FHW7_9AGAR|nr:hypothetical protein D9758_015718 [Tetrapyrgos nigripes]